MVWLAGTSVDDIDGNVTVISTSSNSGKDIIVNGNPVNLTSITIILSTDCPGSISMTPDVSRCAVCPWLPTPEGVSHSEMAVTLW